MNAVTTPRMLRLPAIALVVIFAFSFAGRVMAQKAPPQVDIQTSIVPVSQAQNQALGVPPRFELGVGYSYMHADAEVVRNLNGFTVSAFYNVTPLLQAPVNLNVTPRVTSKGVIKLELGVEFSGLYGTETLNFADGSVKTSQDRYLYMFGPQVTLQPCQYADVFGHVLVGGVHDENKISFMGDTWRSSADALALEVGVGVNAKITSRISIGPEIGYVPIFSKSFNSSTGKHRQDNLMIFLRATIVLP